MKPRLALIVVLALGVLVGGTAATPAFAASAGNAQYAPDEETSLCVENGGVEGANGCEYPCVEADGSPGDTSASSPGQPCEHQEAQSSPPPPAPPAPPAELPYTGFPVVPALLVGLGLLGLGMTMRLRMRSGSGLA
ncbi:MAG TPA: hypothetical protein VK889_10485 [Solirubrobacterales bacterium]|nr:hypothetical protein [Solirubrobacterales bacterium]